MFTLALLTPAGLLTAYQAQLTAIHTDLTRQMVSGVKDATLTCSTQLNILPCIPQQLSQFHLGAGISVSKVYDNLSVCRVYCHSQWNYHQLQRPEEILGEEISFIIYSSCLFQHRQVAELTHSLHISIGEQRL